MINKPNNISDLADKIARSMTYAQERNGQYQIVTPLLYSGGACVVVYMARSENGYFISDHGAARREADLLGGLRTFNRIAKEQAIAHGVNFDSDQIFDIEVPEYALVTAAIAVANASKAAVDITQAAVTQQKAEQQKDALIRKIFSVFDKDQIEVDGEYSGRSENWKFDAVVQAHVPILFQTVSAHQNSVNSAISRFLDIKDAGEDLTVRVAVPTRIRETPHLSLLSRTARIIPVDAGNEMFHALAA
ncbi:hypothetical protein [Brucella pseudintermedia]